MKRGRSKHTSFEEEFEAFVNSLSSAEKVPHAGDHWFAYLNASRNRYREITNAITCSPDPISVLDIGTTPFTLFIKEVHPHYEISTLDILSHMEGPCKVAGIGFKKCNLDEGHIPFADDYFDVVIFCEVLEHVFAPPTEILKEVRRVIRPQGKLILSVPNIAALYQRIRLLFGISPLRPADHQMSRTWHDHIHEYTMKEIASLLEACNFTILNKKYVCANAAKERWVSSLIRRIYDAVVLLIPPFRSTIHIECLKEVLNG